MKSTRIPIDNCPHDFVWDEVAEEEYCRFCGLINKEESGGWTDGTIEKEEDADGPGDM